MTEEESHPESSTERRIMTIKSTIQDIWKSNYIEPLHKLVDITNHLVTHTYFFIKYIFLQEMKNTKDAFDMNAYVNKKFIVEVFLSLIERQVRDGAKTGKSRLGNDVLLFRALINAHKDSYFRLAKYTPPKLTNAQQIALYECEKIHTAYINNIRKHFGNRLRMFLNFCCKIKQRSADIRTRMTKARYSEANIRDVIYRTVTQPVVFAPD
ncbi:hypothetical protein [Parasitella parasitica]|uniref:Uncharacterized protein n=1 Tax=Parasitella parasitica TaxID=35722 RepID=A0A0B7NCJ3_9FUNG|nr:hypothetical protein [Parasitella parasitica]